MRRDVAMAGLGFWLLVSAFLAMIGGRARADATGTGTATAPLPPSGSASAPAPAAPSAPMAPTAPTAPAAPAAPVTPTASTTPAAPTAAPTWGQFHGQVVFSDVLIAPAAQFPSPAAMTDALRRLKRTTVEGAGGFWRLHMVAFLDPQPPTGAFQLRATDVTDPKDRREVRLFDVDGKPGDHELADQRPGGHRGDGVRARAPLRDCRHPPKRRSAGRKRRRLRQRGDNPDVSVSPPSRRSRRGRRGRRRVGRRSPRRPGRARTARTSGPGSCSPRSPSW